MLVPGLMQSSFDAFVQTIRRAPLARVGTADTQVEVIAARSSRMPGP